MTQPAVVVVSYNTREHLRTCLASVMQDRPLEVVVADNGSSDGSIEMVRQEFPSVRLVVDPSNRGYGAAANLGIRDSAAEHVVLLNSDTVLPAGALHAMGAYLHAHPEVAVLGPRLRNPDGSLQRSCYPFPSPTTAFLGETHLGYFIRYVPGLRRRHPRTWAHDAPRAVPWVLGAVLAMRRSALEQAGGFDESFFMYAEEIDLCYRLRAAGWEVHFAPVTDVVHLGGASTANHRAAMRVQFYESMAHFYRLHLPKSSLRAMRAIVRGRAAVGIATDILRLGFARAPERRNRIQDDLRAHRQLASGRWTGVRRG